MPIHRRSFLKLTGGTAASAGFAIGAPAILRAATPVEYDVALAAARHVQLLVRREKDGVLGETRT